MFEDQKNTQQELLIRFPLGRVVATPGAILALEDAGVLPDQLIARHHTGDWGDQPFCFLTSIDSVFDLERIDASFQI